jgi:Integrase core domain
MQKGIKYRPNKLGSPHLNGKVESSQKTDKAEFYATVDFSCDGLDNLLAEWQHYYNWDRPHSAHHGSSSMEKYFELSEETPYSDEVLRNYHRAFERIQDANYKVDWGLRKLKRSL